MRRRCRTAHGALRLRLWQRRDVPDAEEDGEVAARPLGRREIGEIATMAFARVHDHDAGGTACAQHAAGRIDGGAQQRYIIAERGTETTRLEKVALHVDDDQRRGGGVEFEGIRLSVDLRHACFLGTELPEGADFVADQGRWR
jgi:hypothetical protein